ncbi:MAG: hypothetical protein ACFCA4_15400 [Cyanophyceae cyanobacterium]
MQPQYITTDLELESLYDLTPIAQELGNNLVVNFCGEVGDRHGAFFGLFQEESVATDISFYCDLIDKLSGPSRKLFESCTRIDFDIGYEAGDEVNKGRSPISTDVLTRVIKNHGNIIITIYPHGTYKF